MIKFISYGWGHHSGMAAELILGQEDEEGVEKEEGGVQEWTVTAQPSNPDWDLWRRLRKC